MTKHNFGNYQVELDEGATRDWYKNSDEWGCKCGHCLNFLTLARNRKIPIPIIETLEKLGIPPEKATYVCMLYSDEDGLHYQFSYRMAGNMLNKPGNGEPQGRDEGRCCHELYPYGAPDFPNPHFDLEFYAVLPWVLDAPQA